MDNNAALQPSPAVTHSAAVVSPPAPTPSASPPLSDPPAAGASAPPPLSLPLPVSGRRQELGLPPPSLSGKGVRRRPDTVLSLSKELAEGGLGPPLRRRGAQPGNLNALKHGFYARSLSAAARRDLLDAQLNNDLEAEISLLRVRLKELASAPDVKTEAITGVARALAHLVATQYRIEGSRRFWTDAQEYETNYGYLSEWTRREDGRIIARASHRGLAEPPDPLPNIGFQNES